MDIFINESGILPWGKPIDPSIHPCKYCNKPANGSVGNLYDRSYIEWVCEYCYYNVLKMRPLIEIAEENYRKSQNEFNS